MRQLHGDVAHHGLERLALHVERLLAHLRGAALEVGDRSGGGQFLQRHVEARGDLRQALLVAPDCADGPDAGSLQAAHDAGGLLAGIAGLRAEPVSRLVLAAAVA